MSAIGYVDTIIRRRIKLDTLNLVQSFDQNYSLANLGANPTVRRGVDSRLGIVTV